jgi:putative ABC transport system substrate-binding protein
MPRTRSHWAAACDISTSVGDGREPAGIATLPGSDRPGHRLSYGAQRAEALLVGGDPFLFGSSQQIIAMTARHVIPAIYDFREAAISGGLWRMARILPNNYRQLGDRVSRPRGSYWHSAHIATQPVDVDFRR